MLIDSQSSMALGKYRIQRYIGSGPLGDVYAASLNTSPDADATYALKVLRPENVNSDRSRSELAHAFEQSKLLADLPQVAPVLDVVFETSGVYVFSRLDTGACLETVLRRVQAQKYRLPMQDAAALLTAIGAVLAKLHAVGFVHGDLKPHNVRMLHNKTGSGFDRLDIRLADYIFADLVSLCQCMRVHADAAIYAAPEQFAGTNSAASDQYALAAILFRCLTGKTPFLPRSSDSIIYQKRDTTILALRGPGLPAKMLDVLQRALAPSPAARYPTIQDFCQELAQQIDQVNALNEPQPVSVGQPARQGRFTRREALITGVTGVAAAAATFLVAGALRSPLAKIGALASSSSSNAFALPAPIAERTWITQAHHQATTALGWSPTGTRLLTGGADNAVRLWSPDRSVTPLTTIHAVSGVNAVAWSPNEDLIVFGDDSGFVRLATMPNGHIYASKDVRGGKVYGVAWSPNGARFVACSASGRVIVWDTQTRDEVYYLSGIEDAMRAVTTSPDGRWIAAACADRNVYVWDALTGEIVTVLPGSTGIVYALAFSPDSAQLAATGEDTRIRIWGTATFQVAALLPSENIASMRTLRWSSDGQKLAAGSEDGTVVLWDVGASTHERLNMAIGSPVLCLDWKRHTQSIAIGCANGIAAIWQTPVALAE